MTQFVITPHSLACVGERGRPKAFANSLVEQRKDRALRICDLRSSRNVLRKQQGVLPERARVFLRQPRRKRGSIPKQ